MTKSTTHRVFSDILVACSSAKCDVPFFSLPFQFERVDKTASVLQVVDGRAIIPPPRKEEEEEGAKAEFDRIVKLRNKSEIAGDEKNPSVIDSISKIAKYLCQALKATYGSATVSLNCDFGIEKGTDKIYILENSSAESLKEAFLASLMEGVPNGESEFQNFIQCAISPDFFNPPCNKPVHKARKIDVIYYRAHMKFPTVNEYRLYKIIKQRITEMVPNLITETINVCLKCSLNFTGARREAKGSKLTNKLFKENDPHTFEALTPIEMEIRKTQSVGYTQDMHKAFCFTVNLRESPYHSKPLSIHNPPMPRTEKTPQKPLHMSEEEWVLRLTGEKREPGFMVAIPQEKDVNVETVPIPDPKPIPARYSQKLAPKTYTGKPFGYEFIDKKKNGKKNITRKSTSSKQKTPTVDSTEAAQNAPGTGGKNGA